MPKPTNPDPQGLTIQNLIAAVKVAAQGVNVGEHEAAKFLDLSVHTLRKDRQAKRRFPYYRMGGRVVYNLERLRVAMSAMEEGGTTSVRRAGGAV